MMRKYILTLLMIISIAPTSFGFGSYNPNMTYANRARYYSQRNMYANRYQRPRSNYIYSPQQAKYYGYRAPQINGYNPMYYNRYRRY